MSTAEVRPVPPAPTLIVEEPVSALPPVPKAKPVMDVAPVPPLTTASEVVATALPLLMNTVPLFAPHFHWLPM